MDVCVEINAAAPPDQQRFPVSCEVTGLRREKRYRLRPGAGVFTAGAVGRHRYPVGEAMTCPAAEPRHQPAFPAQQESRKSQY